MDFTPYLGWIDVPDPNSPPAGARLIGASDLLRYERGLRDAAAVINGLDARFAAKAHTHSISNVSGLQTALDGKASVASVSTLSTSKLSVNAGMSVVRSDSAGTPRPSGASVVYWISPVEPTEAQVDDLWLNSTTRELTVIS